MHMGVVGIIKLSGIVRTVEVSLWIYDCHVYLQIDRKGRRDDITDMFDGLCRRPRQSPIVTINNYARWDAA